MKKVRFCTIGLWVLTALAAGLLSAPPVRGEVLAIPGTGACEPILAELAEAYRRAHPGDRVVIPPSSGSGGGIQAVLKGEAQVARVARPLKEEEERRGLVRTVFARDAVAFAVGRQVTVAHLSARQLAAIFSGKIKNWKEVGGSEGNIRVIVREPGDSSLIVIQANLDAFREMVFAPSAKVILYDRAAVEALDKYRNSIGFVTLSSLKWSRGGIVPVALDGVAPSRKNILGGKYRLVEDYAFVYKDGIGDTAKRFIDFVFSPEGGKVMEENGLVAAKRK